MEICTRFAPSPTGFIHLGNIRSALFPWALAKKNLGKFILRIEDTDTERSTDEAVQVIIDSLSWLGIDFDEGPYFQSKRLQRYLEIVDNLLKAGHAYKCYMSKEELNVQRERQRQLGLKPKYNGFWRPEYGKILPEPPLDVKPVIRFRNPLNGIVEWPDAVKGNIKIDNTELDDFILIRSDGTPTYNFSVVVDDIDMSITHVIRGDDHVNNTPRQINLFRALSKKEPIYAHLPTVLEENGEKMSKRNGAKSVLDYRDQGFLPDAIINYLARLGWSHGNDEIFSVQKFIEWFDLTGLRKSSSQVNSKKIFSINSHYLGLKNDYELIELLKPFLEKKGLQDFSSDESLLLAVSLFKSRVSTLLELANNVEIFYKKCEVSLEKSDFPSKKIFDAIYCFRKKVDLCSLDSWHPSHISNIIKDVLLENELNMPELAKPLRKILFGVTQTPSLDRMLHILGKQTAIDRLDGYLKMRNAIVDSSRNFI